MSLEGFAHAASLVAKNAYAPYSGLKVGCAVMFDGMPTLFYGTNVENASYGLTICAERAAICAGVSAGLKRLKLVAIACRDKDDNSIPCFTPCGACLQVIAEFSDETTDIFLEGIGCFKLADFLSKPFRVSPVL